MALPSRDGSCGEESKPCLETTLKTMQQVLKNQKNVPKHEALNLLAAEIGKFGSIFFCALCQFQPFESLIGFIRPPKRSPHLSA